MLWNLVVLGRDLKNNAFRCAREDGAMPFFGKVRRVSGKQQAKLSTLRSQGGGAIVWQSDDTKASNQNYPPKLC